MIPQIHILPTERPFPALHTLPEEHLPASLRHLKAVDTLKLRHHVIHPATLRIPVGLLAIQPFSHEDVTILLHLPVEPRLQVTPLQVNHGHLVLIYIIRIHAHHEVRRSQPLDVLELRRTSHLSVHHHTILAFAHKHLQSLVSLSTTLDPHHLQVHQPLRRFRLQVRRSHKDRHLLPCLTLSGQPSCEHQAPVPSISRQSEHLIQSHVVEDEHALLSFRHAHTSTHLLQILVQAQRRSRQLNKLHLRAVKPLREDIHIHNHIDLSLATHFWGQAPSCTLFWGLAPE